MSKDFQAIAIIGIGCRLPGGCNDPQSFWQLLASGRDAISQTPADRWRLEKFYAPDRVCPGKTQSRWGGYVDAIDQFDPQLFGISPREAECMDPQQRMLLETAYRASEDAGVPLADLAGQRVSVHVGISSIDYAVSSLSFRDRGVIGPYSNTGVSGSIAANRISYCFDLRGESVAVDTACSSSLIATHLACQSLQDPANKMALAGGVNALLVPDYYVAFSQLGVLSPDGRCKTFDASANGYVRSEGAGMVLLKRLADAIADGDSIYAVIRGSATNQDGRTEGLTVPSEAAQQQLIRDALQKAAIDAGQISYVEAHGTGTPIGDPIEARAIGKCYGRPGGDPCRIASLKTNIGHLEAGAGIASVIKVALAIKHQQIPAHLNYNTPNPEIDFAESGLVVPRSTEAWQPGGPRLAAINGFGYGGANAHLILGEAGEPAARSSEVSPKPDLVVIPISAHDKTSLANTASNWAEWLETNDVCGQDVAVAAARRRSHHAFRASIIGRDRQAWAEQLRQLAHDPDAMSRQIDSRARTLSSAEPAKIAFVCSGQGPQWWAMGRGLLKSSRVFRERIDACDQEFAKQVSWSLMQELSRDEQESRMQETSIAQPSIFALQMALAEHWRSKGIEPSFVVGHSVGEIAAAYLSGALGFADACQVAVHRGRTMDAATSRGAMIAVGLSVDETRKWISDVADQVAIAAINGPTSLTVSGCADAIAVLHDRMNDAGIFCRRLEVEYAFHSPQMDPVHDELIRSLADLRPIKVTKPMVSTVTGGLIDGTELDGDYWWKNVRESVRFADAMNVLGEQQVDIAIEIGPHPVLKYAIAECFAEHDRPVLTLASLHRKEDDEIQIAQSLGQLYQWGYPLDWSLNAPIAAKHVKLPPLVMHKQALWSESQESRTSRLSPDWNPILGDPIDGSKVGWEKRIDLREQESLEDHRVRDACVLPAAALLHLAATAGLQVGSERAVSLRRFRLRNACLLDPAAAVRLRMTWDEQRRELEVCKSGVDDSDWLQIANVDIAASTATGSLPSGTALRLGDGLTQRVTAEHLYEHCRRLELNYGARFRGVTGARRQDNEALVSIDLSSSEQLKSESKSFGLTPALLDSVFHGMIAADPDFDDPSRGLYLPQQIASVDFFCDASRKLTAHVRIRRKDDVRMVADIDVFNESGEHCIAIRGFESVSVAGTQQTVSVDRLLYRLIWKPADRSAASDEITNNRTWLLFQDQSGTASKLVGGFPASDRLITVQHGTSFKRLGDDSFIVDPENREHFERLMLDVGNGVTDVVYLWGLDAPENVELSEAALNKSTALTVTAPLHLAVAWQAAYDANDQINIARLSLVTRNAQPPDDALQPISVAAGPLIGFGRVVISECRSLRTKLIDLAADNPSDREDLLAEMVRRVDGEDEVMIRDSIRWVRRFVPSSEHPLHVENPKRSACALRRGQSAGIDELRYETTGPMPLGENQVEIEVVSSGLNFSDVMKSLDLYPGLPDGPVVMGAECSGRIRRLGRAVSEFQIGDEVIAVAPGSFATQVAVDKNLVVRKPTTLTHPEAAAIPIAYLTAHYALLHCARIQPPDRVLIHSASGGVGIAATKLAARVGATVFATAGTEQKRDFVRQSGVDVVMNSRTLDFARETLQQTDGQGVDVVLNSLPGEAIKAGLSVLRVGGRFLEIGKRDIYADVSLGLEPFKNNLAFFAIDLDQLLRQQPERIGQMLRELMAQFESGELTPPPVKTFVADETQDAFRLMQQGKHIGKVVVDYRGGVRDVYAGTTQPLRFKADRTYWIAGGLGGFGLRVAEWLVQQGAKHLVLGGRSTALSAEQQAVLDAWKKSGVSVEHLPVDLTSLQSVQSVVEEIDRRCRPLAGVYHTAMILEDRLLQDLDEATLQRVLGPKLLGGWNLHQATDGHDLDQFVLFSSLTSVFGHAGQANYASANAFLDSLAHYRRSLGMPAVAINWGHVGEVGYLSRRAELSSRLERQGVLAFTAEEAMRCLEHILQTDTIQQSVLRMDWTKWRGLGITGDVSPRFAHLLQGKPETFSDQQRQASAAEIRAAEPEPRRAMIANLIGAKAASLLGISQENLAWDQPLLSMGLDSLMAVEMRNWIESRLEIDFPISDLMRNEGLRQICETAAEIIETVPSGDNEVAAETLLQQLPEMSDNEVESLLAKMLDPSQSESRRE